MSIWDRLRGICSKELLDDILEAYIEEMREDGYEDSEKQYQKSKCKLDSTLTDKQKTDLSLMEKKFTENMQYNFGFGFRKGLYTGFEQFFIGVSTSMPFYHFVHNEILTMPNMKKYREYYDRLTEINKLFEGIIENLEEDYKEDVTTVYSFCDEKNYNVLRYSFYLGYRYALSIIGDIHPLEIGEITDKILCTEHELEFTLTCEERERRRYACHEKDKIR